MFSVAAVAQPLVVQDVSAPDTYASVAAALKALADTTDKVFTTIEGRVALERSRLKVLNDRIAKCRERVKRVTGSTKAITLFASPKYPATEVQRLASFPCLIDGTEYPSLSEPMDPSLAPFGAAPLFKGDMVPDDEVLTRPVKRREVEHLIGRVSLARAGTAIATPASGTAAARAAYSFLPAYLPSVCSTLLFNSRLNPYRAMQTLDDLVTEDDERVAASVLRSEAGAALSKKAQTLAEEEARRLASAPTSLLEGDQMPALAQIEFGYKPKMKELEAFALPSNLALPNVAEVAFAADGALAPIAPSVVKAGEINLPTILDLMPSLPPVSPAAPPPPPPPGVAATTAAPPPPVVPAPPPPVSVAAPPPPPVAVPPPAPTLPAAAPVPTPPTAAPALPAVEPASAPAPVPPPTPSAGGMAGLLGALNNPDNIKKLRKAPSGSDGQGGGGSGEGEEEGGKGQGSRRPTVAKPLSMMEEMQLKLSMKREAMNMAGGKAPAASSSAAGGAGASLPKLPSITEAGDGGAGARRSDGLPPLPGAGHKASATMSDLPSLSKAPGGDGGGAAGMGGFRPDNMPGFASMASRMKTKARRNSEWGSESEDEDD